MTALVKGVALGVTADCPEAETYSVDDRVVWADDRGREHRATVVEVWDDCIEIRVDYRAGTYLVFASELRPAEVAAGVQR